MTVYRLIKAGELGAVRVGKSYRLARTTSTATWPAATPRRAERRDVQRRRAATPVASRPHHGRYDTISFLSDYGTADEFVGVVKSVIRQIAPGGRRHRPHPRDRRPTTCGPAASPWPAPRSTSRPASCWRWSTPASAPSAGRSPSRSATARRCSSDPTTGCSRRPWRMVGGATRAVELDEPRATSSRRPARPSPAATSSPRPPRTSAPACRSSELGPDDRPAALRPGHRCRSPGEEDGALVAEVLWVDRFGNAQLNVDPDEVADVRRPDRRCGIGGTTPHRPCRVRHLRRRRPGELGLVVDSYGLAVGRPRPAFGGRGARARRRRRGASSGRSRTAGRPAPGRRR